MQSTGKVPGIQPKRLYLGWSPARGNPLPWKYFHVPHLMINAFDFARRAWAKASFAKEAGYRGEVFCDSGGYQLLTRREAIPVGRILEIQRILGAQLNAALDDSRDVAEHIRNLRSWLHYSERFPSFRVVPVIPYDVRPKDLRTISRICSGPAVVAIGKVAPTLGPLRRPDSFRKVLYALRQIRDAFPVSRLHVFGVGGLPTAILLFHFVDSVDSSSWVHEARFGRVRTFGGATASVKSLRAARQFLCSNAGTCPCPTCVKGCATSIAANGVRGTVARSLHNAWVLLREVAVLNESMTAGRFHDFAEARVDRSPWHRALLRDARALI